MSELTPNFFKLIPIIEEEPLHDKSSLIDLYNKVDDPSLINSQMHQKIFSPYFKSIQSLLPYDGTKYSFFQIINIYTQQTNFEYTQFFKIDMRKEQKYFKLELIKLKNTSFGDNVMTKLNEITEYVLLQQKESDMLYLKSIELNYSHE